MTPGSLDPTAPGGAADAPVVTSIHLAPKKSAPTRSVENVIAEEGAGLIGDRYHGSRHRHVSVQSAQELEEAARILGAPIAAGDTRRNITLSHGRVPTAPGSRITLGDVELEVVRLAAPCRIMNESVGPGAARALRFKAGSICRVLRGGEISVGTVTEGTAVEA